ncbi:MAG: TIGR02757 family protein [Nitrospirae bacterium]|nr:TIGR02757 family protein [Nitrospirota bacterium]
MVTYDRSALLEKILRDLSDDKDHLLQRRLGDPVHYLHQYRRSEDIEVAGMIASSLAFGKVSLFRPVLEKILAAAGKHPAEFVASFHPVRDAGMFQGLYYRMCREKDLVCWFYLIGEILRRYGSIGKLFTSIFREEQDIRKTLLRVSHIFLNMDTSPVFKKKIYSRGLRQLLPSPEHGGPCKRWNMYLRWMVRPADGIDFGLWKEIPPSALMIPLDTHIARISRYLRLSTRKTANWKMAEEITNRLKRFYPDDPVKYDFALCHVGISGQCPAKPVPQNCLGCRFKPVCFMGKKVLSRTGIASRGD